MTPPRVALAALALGSAACSVLQFVPTNPPPRAPVPHPASDIEVFTSGPPARPHADIGIISSGWGPGYMDLNDLRREAASRGCDAVVLGCRFATCIMYTGHGGT